MPAALSLKEAATFVGYPYKSFAKVVARGEIASFKRKRLVQVPKKDLERWQMEHYRPSNTELAKRIRAIKKVEGRG